MPRRETKAERDAALIAAYRTQWPVSLDAIGAQFGITKERAGQRLQPILRVAPAGSMPSCGR